MLTIQTTYPDGETSEGRYFLKMADAIALYDDAAHNSRYLDGTHKRLSEMLPAIEQWERIPERYRAA